MRKSAKRIRTTASGIGLSLVLFFILCVSPKAHAQLYPLVATYFDNQYIANPAMAGIEQGVKFDLSFRKQWNDIPGSPLTQNLTAAYGYNKVGLGLNISNESEGLLHNTRIVGTYAYHIPANDQKDKLSFAMSLGLIDQRLRDEDVIGDPDIIVSRYNTRRQTYIDGDFGIAYISDKFTVQAAIPNMKSFFRKDFNRVADLPVFFTAISYKVNISEGVDALSLEPKICYRGVKNFKNMWDAGTNVNFANNRLNLMGMYHSTQSLTVGLGFDYNTKWRFSSSFTSASSALKGYVNTGDFEIGIKLSLD